MICHLLIIQIGYVNLKKKLEDAYGVMRSCKSKKDKQYNEKKQDKSTNTDHQNITPETKDN